jgi:hypothetical protein
MRVAGERDELDERRIRPGAPSAVAVADNNSVDVIRNQSSDRVASHQTTNSRGRRKRRFVRGRWHRTCRSRVRTSSIELAVRVATTPNIAQRDRPRARRAEDDLSPFPSLESAQEYIALLAIAVVDAQSDIQQDIDAAGNENADRRLAALRLVDYKLNQLRNHMSTTGRLLNDLRSLRRLLLAERGLNTTSSLRHAR